MTLFLWSFFFFLSFFCKTPCCLLLRWTLCSQVEHKHFLLSSKPNVKDMSCWTDNVLFFLYFLLKFSLKMCQANITRMWKLFLFVCVKQKKWLTLVGLFYVCAGINFVPQGVNIYVLRHEEYSKNHELCFRLVCLLVTRWQKSVVLKMNILTISICEVFFIIWVLVDVSHLTHFV